jgi:EamA domain-containing membrane protein RarD
VVIAIVLAVFFNLSRIASLGAILYLVMDIAIHWGVYRHLRDEVKAKTWILFAAIALDVIVLSAFCIMKFRSDPMILVVAAGTLGLVTLGEWFFISRRPDQPENSHSHH